MLGAVCGAVPAVSWALLEPTELPGVAYASRTVVEPAIHPVIPPTPEDSRSPVEAGEDVLATLRARLADESQRSSRASALRELAALGSPEALDLLFEQLFDDPGSFGAETIWSLLKDVDDPRVYQLARTEFEHALADGLSGARHTCGYLRLIASHGGAEGAELILSQVLAEGEVRAQEAAQAVGYLDDHSHGSAYLDALTRPEVPGKRFVGRGLAHWGDPFVTEGLLLLGRSPNVEEPLRRAVLRELGYAAKDTSDVDAIVSQYWSTGDDDPAGIRVAMYGLRGLQENPWIDRNLVASRATDVINHLLTTEHWVQGVSFVSEYPAWKTSETKNARLSCTFSGSLRGRIQARLG